MATILLSAAGAAIGSSVGGSLLGLSATAIGRFAGATLGRALDQRLLGQGAEAVEVGRVDRFRLSGVGEGAAVQRVFGRMRIGGHVIWASRFTERVTTSGGGGGKGAPPQPEVKRYSYSVNLAVALCEGEISGVTRVWADGVEVEMRDLNMRVYPGSADQMPDPVIEAVEGAGQVPAYRGTAYVVFDDLALERFGNRVPQFSFEVCRPDLNDGADPASAVRGVALLPGSGEYALATTPVHFKFGGGEVSVANVNSASGQSDLATALDMLETELPNCQAVSLIVSWFGDDLRCGTCSLQPRVEQDQYDAGNMPWSVAGLDRTSAGTVPLLDGAPVYGGTPTDRSVVQAIRAAQDAGQAVLYYPFILMQQLAGNGLSDPWTGATDQPALPWRGRITLSVAPGREGTPDGSAAADAEVAAFFGTASASDFAINGDTVTYSGPSEWGYRRFILHQAALCAAAGGVESFCIGSEMRGLTQIRGASGFVAVDQLIALAAECRALLGPEVKIGYAADWSEYFGYHPQDGSGDVYFHLDPLWADGNIDFIGIDNYMPLSDWRDGTDHADAGFRSIYNDGYLQANVAGGEGYDWYYPTPEARAAQRREPITDGAYGEPWVWRYKDIANWWSNAHHDRVGGSRLTNPTAWVPGSKPVWFTELGCAAIDKGTNQPNKFLDPKSSESKIPHYSNGLRDELIQRQYLRAMLDFWGNPENNPVSEVYGEPMIDLDHSYVWAWDARPYPWFPNNAALWNDGDNYRRGHWITGRMSARTLASVVTELCLSSGVVHFDTSQLHGIVRGYVVPDVGDARAALQPLMLTYGFDAVERGGVLEFRMRNNPFSEQIQVDLLVDQGADEGDLIEVRAGERDMAGRVRLGFVEADGDYRAVSEESVLPEDATHGVAASQVAVSLTRSEGRQTVERWLSEARIARDTFRFALPPSQRAIGAGDIVRFPATGGKGAALARIDRVELGDYQILEAVRMDPSIYAPAEFPDDPVSLKAFVPAVPALGLFLDLPLISGQEVPHAPHFAATSRPWAGSVAVYSAAEDAGYGLDTVIASRATVGVTQTPLPSAPAGRVDHGDGLIVKLTSGALSSTTDEGLLAGRNLVAIGDGTPGGWELFQFRDAELIDTRTWMLSHRLRGQFGTDGVMPATHPAGSYVVVMDGVPVQMDLAAADRGISRHYRYGPVGRSLDDPSYEHEVHAFDGIGLRPYRPAHLRAEASAGDVDITWIRRTRIDGDLWGEADVPLGEETESYVVRVIQGAQVLREATVSQTGWTYDAAMQAADGVGAAYSIEVAQVSARFGPGPFARIDIGS